MHPARVLLALSCLCLAGTACAEVYRWVDDRGRVHFGDHPGTVQADKIDLPEEKMEPQRIDQQQRDAERKAVQQRLLDAYEDERESKRQQREEQQAKERRREQNCIYARNRLREYENSGSLYEPLAGGERRYLSSAERREEINGARTEVERWCDDQAD